MSNKKVQYFDLSAILSIILDRNLCKKFYDVYELVWFVCNDNLINDTGIRVESVRIKPHLLAIHPYLSSITFKEGENIDEFLKAQEEKFGTNLPVTRLGVELPKRCIKKIARRQK